MALSQFLPGENISGELWKKMPIGAGNVCFCLFFAKNRPRPKQNKKRFLKYFYAFLYFFCIFCFFLFFFSKIVLDLNKKKQKNVAPHCFINMLIQNPRFTKLTYCHNNRCLRAMGSTYSHLEILARVQDSSKDHTV